MNTPEKDFPSVGKSHHGRRHIGHAHFWEHAMMSRRQFIGTSIGATAAVTLGSGLWLPSTVLADSATPRPIPGGIQPFGPGTKVFHVFLPTPGMELSTITDFHGAIGVAEIMGHGTGTNTHTGESVRLIFDVDVRFMQGRLIATDGDAHQGTFALI